MNKISTFLLLIAILLTGAVLRITGLEWGLTSTKYFHANSYHPDEADNFNAIRKFDIKKHDFRIKNYLASRGTFQVYMTAAWVKMTSMLGFTKSSVSFNYYKDNMRELAKLFISARSMSVFFSMLTIITVFFIGKIFYSESIGLLAAFFVAIAPGHVVWSHYMGTELILNFQISLIILLSFMVMTKTSPAYLILAGVITGLTIATKYSAAPLAVIPLIAYIMRPGLLISPFKVDKFANRQTVLYLFMLVVGFILGNPYSVLDPETIVSALRSSVNLNLLIDGRINTMDCFEPMPGWIYYLSVSPKYTLGMPFLLLSGISVIYAFIKREKTDILLLAVLILLWALLGASPWRLARWSVAFIPVLCVLSARFVMSIQRYRVISLVAVGLISVYTLAYSYAHVNLMSKTDVRDEASYWIEENIPEGSKIGVPYMYFWNPSIVMAEYWYKSDESVLKGLKKYDMVQLTEKIENLKKENPDYVILSDYEYYPVLCLNNKFPHPEVLPMLNDIMSGSNYRLVKTFERYPEFLGIKMIDGSAPHDWRYICPVIRIYKRS